MKVEKDRMVSVSYELFEGNYEGEPVEKVDNENPLTFLYDSGKLLKSFEESLEGKQKGDRFECLLKPENAYGEHHKDRIIDIPKKAFEIDGKIDENMVAVGKTIPMQDKSGNKFNGVILEIKADDIQVDFNHPMAGRTLAFKGEIVEVREATEKELNAHKLGHDASECEGCQGDCD